MTDTNILNKICVSLICSTPILVQYATPLKSVAIHDLLLVIFSIICFYGIMIKGSIERNQLNLFIPFIIYLIISGSNIFMIPPLFYIFNGTYFKKSNS